MKLSEIYTFEGEYFDQDGRREDGVLFRDIVKGFEKKFHKRFAPFYANFFVANLKTMLFLERCNPRREKPCFFGMELINEKFDFETNHKIAEAACKEIVCGIDVYYDEEPFWLFIDSDMPDNTVKLLYMPDGDDDDDDEVPIPFGVNSDVRKKVLV